jgi:eukaryotic-like serine/threonine-protein kinase
MSLVGKTLNRRFYIRKPLNRGGFAHTYLAEDKRESRQICVVKHIDPVKENLQHLDLDKIETAFNREADILQKLGDNSNLIPTLIDRFEQAGEFYIVQEFIDGETLAVELTPGNKLTPGDTIDLLIQILTPLKYCHQENLIHRDLKPDNIMRRRETGELVLIDFGISKDMSAASVTSRSYSGTPGYAPWEQMQGAKPETANDIYAVGMIAMQALTGMHPTELLDHHKMEHDLHKYCDITDDFAAVLNQMGAFFAINRYQNAQEALAAVQALPPMRRKFRFESAKLEIVTTESITETENVTRKGFLGFNKQVEIKKEIKVKKLQPKITYIPGEAEYITEDLGNSVRLEMVYIEAGSFIMGSYEHSCEQPIHRITMLPFYMGRYAITQKQYQEIMNTNPSRFKGDNRPVETVSYDDAMEFCKKLSKYTGQQYTIPSESQWEYACRAGTTTPLLFWRNDYP